MRRTELVHHTERIHAAIATGEAAKSALVASWRRSSTLHHLDPAERQAPLRLTDFELKLARQHIEPLIRASQASLDRLYSAVGGIGCCVLLADRDGVPVERRGAPADDRLFNEWGLWTGSVWSEEAEGTNGIGTCLVEQRALTIHRDQHFHTRNTLFSCTTAPIYDHEGNLAAALDVSSCRADLTEDFVNVISIAVNDAARKIEVENFRMVFPQARIIMATAGERVPNALVAVDGDDLVIGATRSARQMLGITDEALPRTLLASEVLGVNNAAANDLAQAEQTVLRRALIKAGGNVSVAAQDLGVSRATLHRKLAKYRIRRLRRVA